MSIERKFSSIMTPTPTAPSAKSSTAPPIVWTYQLVESQPLPTLDLSRTFLSWIVPVTSPNHERYLTFMKHHYAKLVIFFRAGLISFTISFFVSIEISAYFVIAALVLSFPTMVSAWSLMSRDMVRLLFTNHEFLFFSLVNITTSVVLAMIFSDIRIIGAVLYWQATQMTILSDALFRTIISTSKSMVTGIPAVLSIGILVFFGRVEGQYDPLQLGYLHLKIEELFLNASLTLMVFISRAVYKRRHVLSQATSKLITCAIYRTRLKLVPLNTGASPSENPQRPTTSKAKSQRAVIPMTTGPHTDLLVLVPTPQTAADRSMGYQASYNRLKPHLQPLRMPPLRLSCIDARNAIVPRLIPHKPIAWEWLVFLHLNGACGLLLCLVSLFYLKLATVNERSFLTFLIPIVAFCTSFTFMVTTMCMFQRQLLGRLLHNFDIVFISWQIVTGGLCLADMLRWDVRSLVVLTFMGWFLWILLLDAVPPVLRQHLHLSKKYYGGIVASSLLMAMGRILYNFIINQETGFEDHILFRIEWSATRTHEMRTASFFLNRSFPVLIWMLRLLWAFLMRPDEELVFITGNVEYLSPFEMYPPLTRRVAITATDTTVAMMRNEQRSRPQGKRKLPSTRRSSIRSSYHNNSTVPRSSRNGTHDVTHQY